MKVYNKLPSHLNNLHNTHLFWRKPKSLLMQQTFYSLKECVLWSWNMKTIILY